MLLTDRFTEALGYAERCHRDQKRKGSAVPYVSHLLAVCATVLEHGGDEDEAIAALLHDAVEDQGGAGRLEDIRRRFGWRVAALVDSCSDSAAAPGEAKAPWLERKQAHIAKMAKADRSEALVVAADKLHNLRDMVRDVRRHGPATMSRFNAPPERILWFHREVARALRPHAGTAPVDEVAAATEELAALLGLPSH